MAAPELEKHSFSIYDLGMRNIANSQGEDLFGIIRSMPRVIVDNNAEWKSRSQREVNRAFLIGRTIDNETPNLEGVLFNEKVAGGRENVFLTGIEEARGMNLIVIHRLDPHFKAIFRGPLPRLNQMSPGEKAKWNAPAARADLRERILFEVIRSSDAEMLARIAELSARSYCNYEISYTAASLAYGLMLSNSFHRDKAEIQKFLDNQENLFGDTVVIQEALFYDADILSHDGHVRAMAMYTGRVCLS